MEIAIVVSSLLCPVFTGNVEKLIDKDDGVLCFGTHDSQIGPKPLAKAIELVHNNNHQQLDKYISADEAYREYLNLKITKERFRRLIKLLDKDREDDIGEPMLAWMARLRESVFILPTLCREYTAIDVGKAMHDYTSQLSFAAVFKSPCRLGVNLMVIEYFSDLVQYSKQNFDKPELQERAEKIIDMVSTKSFLRLFFPELGSCVEKKRDDFLLRYSPHYIKEFVSNTIVLMAAESVLLRFRLRSNQLYRSEMKDYENIDKYAKFQFLLSRVPNNLITCFGAGCKPLIGTRVFETLLAMHEFYTIESFFEPPSNGKVLGLFITLQNDPEDTMDRLKGLNSVIDRNSLSIATLLIAVTGSHVGVHFSREGNPLTGYILQGQPDECGSSNMSQMVDYLNLLYHKVPQADREATIEKLVNLLGNVLHVPVDLESLDADLRARQFVCPVCNPERHAMKTFSVRQYLGSRYKPLSKSMSHNLKRTV